MFVFFCFFYYYYYYYYYLFIFKLRIPYRLVGDAMTYMLNYAVKFVGGVRLRAEVCCFGSAR